MLQSLEAHGPAVGLVSDNCWVHDSYALLACDVQVSL